MTVYFYNKDTIDLSAIAVMGVSVKTGDTPIGFFGTGLKFSIATLLRNGCHVKLIRDGEEIEFKTRSELIRGETFDRVMMGDEALGFTTKLGRTWELWQAYRELYCNCLDEAGSIGTSMPDGGWGTIFAVDGEGFEKCHRERHEIFVSTDPIASNEKCEIHPGETMFAFYRGVKAHAHRKPAVYTYNIKTALTLTEDRTVKESIYLDRAVAEFITQINNDDVVESIVTAHKESYEGSLDFDWNSFKPSQSFMRVCHRHRYNLKANHSAIQLWQKHASAQLLYEPAELDLADEATLEQAFKLLARIGCPITQEDFLVTRSLGEGFFGAVKNGQILIAHRTFDMGPRFLASTLYEEWLHRDLHFADQSRDLQNYLFEKLFSMVERVCGLDDALSKRPVAKVQVKEEAA